MNYVINATIYKTIDVNYMEKDSKGAALEPKLKKVSSIRKSFNILVSGTNTLAELKAKVKAELALPDTITDVKVIALNKELTVDADAVTAYGISYEATLPYVEPAKN